MILTFTPNPAIDATLVLDQRFVRGAVHRTSHALRNPGGKGVNVTHAVHKAGIFTKALVPVGRLDPFVPLAQAAGVPLITVTVDGMVRTNTAVTEPDGTTTKVNEPGARLGTDDIAALEASLAHHATEARAVVLAGSLPPGAPEDWYPRLVDLVRDSNPDALVAVDTSDAPLVALGQRLDTSAPTVLKPNAFEVAQLTGDDGHALEAAADAGNYEPVVRAARALNERGIDELLVTLGGAGAILVTPAGVWAATPPPTTVLSTVGAGDSSLAGYLLARVEGHSPAECLRTAVAYGSAAAALPGTQIPSRQQTNTAETTVTPL